MVIYVYYLSSLKQSRKVSILIPILQISKMRLREIK